MTEDALRNQQALSPAARDSLLASIETAPALVKPFIRRAVVDPTGFKKGLLETMPRMLFALLPVFAALVALFYHGRKYPEHLYFAIHLHAFIFLALGVAKLARFAHVPAIAVVASTFVLVWIPVYTTLAFRRAYGGSVGRTMAMELGIGVIYGALALIALVATAFWVARFG